MFSVQVRSGLGCGIGLGPSYWAFPLSRPYPLLGLSNSPDLYRKKCLPNVVTFFSFKASRRKKISSREGCHLSHSPTHGGGENAHVPDPFSRTHGRSVPETGPRPGPFNPTEGQRLFQQLIDGLRYCHSKGVYHWDLKVNVKDTGILGFISLSDESLSYFRSSNILFYSNFRRTVFSTPPVGALL